MKRVIKAARYMGRDYRFEIHRTSPDGNDCLLGASNDIKEAERIAIDHVKEMYSNPFKTTKRKRHFIENTYMYDSELDQDADTIEFSNIQELYLAKLEV